LPRGDLLRGSAAGAQCWLTRASTWPNESSFARMPLERRRNAYHGRAKVPDEASRLPTARIATATHEVMGKRSQVVDSF